MLLEMVWKMTGREICEAACPNSGRAASPRPVHRSSKRMCRHDRLKRLPHWSVDQGTAGAGTRPERFCEPLGNRRTDASTVTGCAGY